MLLILLLLMMMMMMMMMVMVMLLLLMLMLEVLQQSRVPQALPKTRTLQRQAGFEWRFPETARQSRRVARSARVTWCENKRKKEKKKKKKKKKKKTQVTFGCVGALVMHYSCSV
jgi:predicted Holliday junction resolvase-like endonuclease